MLISILYDRIKVGGLNEYPDADALSEIAISSAKSFEQLVGTEPKVAMLSYSTYGSAHSPLTDKNVKF